jgi:hypothetical protein
MPGRAVRGGLLALAVLTMIVVAAPSSVAAATRQATPLPGGIGIGLVGMPGSSAGGPLARLYVIDRLAPGKSLQRRVEIINSTKASEDVAVYVAAAKISRGGFEFAAGDSQDELSSWTSVSQGLVHLAGGTDAFDTLTIDVPKNASSGEGYAVLWAQVATVPSDQSGVRLVSRVGVRMYISVSPGGTPVSNFAIGPLTAERSPTGQPLVVAEVHNIGHSVLDISGDLTLSHGPGNLGAGPLAAKLAKELTPGGSELATVPLGTGIPLGPWRAQLLLMSGLVHRSAEATIMFPSVARASTAPAGPSPLLLAAIAAIAAIGLLAFTAVALSASRGRNPKRRGLHSRPMRWRPS